MTIQIRHLGLDEGLLVDYQEAWAEQRVLHDAVAAGERGDIILLLEHADVYTAGRRTEPHERPFDGTPVVDVDRGGKITWHGPGQLVGYPILKLPQGIYVVDYVRRLEEALIRLVASYGVTAGRVRGRSGVWVPADDRGPDRKVAAIGIRVAHNTTLHGFALNVAPDLAAFGRIVPCGISDAGVTSLKFELGDAAPTLAQVTQDVVPYLTEMFAWQPYDQSPDVAEPVAS